MWWASRSRLNLAHSIRSRFLLSWATSAIFLFSPISIVLYFIWAGAGRPRPPGASKESIVWDQSRGWLSGSDMKTPSGNPATRLRPRPALGLASRILPAASVLILAGCTTTTYLPEQQTQYVQGPPQAP